MTFNDGCKGTVAISPEWLTGVFSELKNPQIFNNVSVQYGAITWANGLDLDPKTIYDSIKNSAATH